jgi:hypothetical protein
MAFFRGIRADIFVFEVLVRISVTPFAKFYTLGTSETLLISRFSRHFILLILFSHLRYNNYFTKI